jgi:hypothetical protein
MHPRSAIAHSFMLLPMYLLAALPANAQFISTPNGDISTGSFSQGNTPLDGGVFTDTTNPNLYGKSKGGISSQQIDQGLNVGQDVLNGNYAGAIKDAPSLLKSLGVPINSTTENILGVAPNVLSNLTSGNFGGLAQQAPSILKTFGVKVSPKISNILGAGGSLLTDLIGGKLTLKSVLNAALGFLGLGGGGGSTISFTNLLTGISSDSITDSVTGAVFGTVNNPLSQSLGQTSADTNSVLARTGSALCSYNSSCLESNPNEYRSLYSDGAGDMGYANPNEVASKIWKLSREGILPDSFADDATQNAIYVGHDADNQISRATTESVLSKPAQAATAKAIEAANTSSQTATQLSDECAKSATATQDLVRCSLQVGTPQVAYLAAIHNSGLRQREDFQFQKIHLANISNSLDATRRNEDVDKSALVNAMGNVFFYEPHAQNR